MTPPERENKPRGVREALERAGGARALFRQIPRTLGLVREASLRLGVGLIATTLVSALLPAAIAWVGKLIIDGVVLAARTGATEDRNRVLMLVGLELLLMMGAALATRLATLCRELLRGLLGQRVNIRILEKAITLEVRHFEDSDVYDKMQNARREAGTRPLGLVTKALSIGQNTVTLLTLSALLIGLSPWAVLVLLLSAVPAFVTEARVSADSFRLWSWRAPEGRRLNYLEWILTRDSHVKEVKAYGLGEHVLDRYKELFARFYVEDRALAFRRLKWSIATALFSLTAFYLVYASVAHRATAGELTLGELTLALAVFRQGQAAFQAVLTGVSGIYEDSLFMSNLFTFLDMETIEGSVLPPGAAAGATGQAGAQRPPSTSGSSGEEPGEARDERARVTAGAVQLPEHPEIRFEGVSYRYPGRDAWSLRDIDLTLPPGEKLALVGENGAGKSTLLRLLLRLDDPTEGRLLWGGVDVRTLPRDAVRQRVSVVFQDFVRYQLSAAENIGFGDLAGLEDRERISRAAAAGGADAVLTELPEGLDTVLGGWFAKGKELSGGQWQKLAVARAFMRDADVLVLDEPTANIDAEAEEALFERFRSLAADRSAVIVSHRFSTVRMADRIAVLEAGRIIEIGSHEALMEKDGRYAHLFRLQAKAYQ